MSALRVDGIDLSHHNADPDYRHLRRNGARFVSYKATEGNHTAWPGDYNRNRGKAAGHMAFGAYHFARPYAANQGAGQARHFLSVAKPKNGDFRPMLDLETNDGHLNRRDLTRFVRDFVNVVKDETGEPPWIYCGSEAARVGLDDTFNCPLWAPRYSDPNYPPHVPHPWDTFTIFQFSNGVAGTPNHVGGYHCDLNHLNTDNPKALVRIFTLGAGKPKEPRVALTKADIERLLNSDAIPNKGPQRKKNKTVQFDNAISDTREWAREAKDRVGSIFIPGNSVLAGKTKRKRCGLREAVSNIWWEVAQARINSSETHAKAIAAAVVAALPPASKGGLTQDDIESAVKQALREGTK